MSKISLNGNWNFLPDPENKFTAEELFDPRRFSQADKMNIPVNWEKANLENYSGVVWYFKSFRIHNTRDNNRISLLKFYGVDYYTHVWLNGNYIGEHEGYFQAFDFDVTKFLKFGEINQLLVKVNSPKEEPGKVWPLNKQLIKGIFNHHDCRPGSWSMEYGQDKNTGGIWNDVDLFVNEKFYVRNTKITSQLSDDYKVARIKINIDCRSSIKTQTDTKLIVKIESPDSSTYTYEKDVIISPGESRINVLFKVMRPKLWWSWDLGKPNLYKINLNFVNLKSYEKEFAIRKVELDKNSRFLLNGKELFLRGTNIIPTQFLSELDNNRISKIVELIKKANINAVRVHAHVNRNELYSEFDKKGIIVWQDFSLQWTYEESDAFAENAVRQIKEMVDQLYNHPSICFWCCHNEPGEQINTLDKLLYDAVLSRDQSRIIRLASNYEEHPYDGWYWGNMEHFCATPMGPLVTEYGAQALPNKTSMEKFIPKEMLFPPDLKHWGYHNFQPDTTFNVAKIAIGNDIDEFIENSQNYQSKLLRTAIHFYRRKKNDGITGIFQFMFVDCWPSITWSVVDYYLVKKKAYNTLKECYSPILLSVNLRRDHYFVGSVLDIELSLINDTYKKIKNAEVKIKIDRLPVKTIKNISVNENSVLFRSAETLKIGIPKSIGSGDHDLLFSFIVNKKIVSSNQFKILLKKYEDQ